MDRRDRGDPAGRELRIGEAIKRYRRSGLNDVANARWFTFLIGPLALCGCVQERCDRAINEHTAVQIAKEHFLTRSIGKLEAGTPAEREAAKTMRKAGVTEEVYRDIFVRALFGRARYVASIFCDHPLIYYRAGISRRGDFSVHFYRVFPDVDNKDWRTIETGIKITKCGNIRTNLWAVSYPSFRDPSVYGPKFIGFVACPY